MSADNAVAQARTAEPARPVVPVPEGFTAFFHEHYRTLMKAAMYAGATRMEADEAAHLAMGEVLRRWTSLEDPLAYGRRAVVTNFIKAKTRGSDPFGTRQRCSPLEMATRDDPALTLWEDQEWVIQLLRSLPPAQREVMAGVLDGFKPSEIAELLGRSPDAVRQSLREARIRLRTALDQDRASDAGKGFMSKEGR